MSHCCALPWANQVKLFFFSILILFTLLFGFTFTSQAQPCMTGAGAIACTSDAQCMNRCGECWSCDGGLCGPNDPMSICSSRAATGIDGLARSCIIGECSFNDRSISASGCDYSAAFYTSARDAGFPPGDPATLPEAPACYVCSLTIPETSPALACGNGICEPKIGETCDTCPVDCRLPDSPSCLGDTTGIGCFDVTGGMQARDSICEDGDVCTINRCPETVCVPPEPQVCSGNESDLCCPTDCAGPVGTSGALWGVCPDPAGNCDVDCWPDLNASCNNGILELDSGETCDDGVNGLGDMPDLLAGGFTNTTIVPPLTVSAIEPQCRDSGPEACTFCGDAIVQASETCDAALVGRVFTAPANCRPWDADGDGMADAAPCTYCGDGTMDPGETCEVGDPGCRLPLTPSSIIADECSFCGDGITNVMAGEACDDGPTGSATCSPSCESMTPPFCGNGIIDTGESCEDGAGPVSDDDCRDADCRYCGDGSQEPLFESCDPVAPGAPSNCRPLGNPAPCTYCGDGNLESVAGETCDGTAVTMQGGLAVPTTCRSDCTFCGDGTLNGAEECDDGNLDNGDGCSQNCENEIPPFCGDGTQNQASETCDMDDGVPVSGQCRVDCTFCGDNLVQNPPETCDPGDAAAPFNCRAWDRTGDGAEDPGACTFCGDGLVQDPPESCDPMDRSPGAPTNCRPAVDEDGDGNEDPGACTRCGDNVVQVGLEFCDDGNNISGDGCSSRCEFETENNPFCGDGVVTPTLGETCDGTPECYADCTFCGDGTINFAFGEECEAGDLGNCDPAAGCNTASCRCNLPLCGDGNLDPGEQCDPARAGAPASCRAPGTPLPCTYCGDGTVDHAAGEVCELGDPTSACPDVGCNTLNCQCNLPLCGNGSLDPEAGETCDFTAPGDPPLLGCRNNTSPRPCTFCGDGTLDSLAGEACDDGNNVSGDGCSSRCEEEGNLPFCGDGINNQDIEQCDGDDNANCAGAPCTAICTCGEIIPNICGNGIVDPGEECDGDATENCNIASLGCSDDCKCGLIEGSGEITGGCSLKKTSKQQHNLLEVFVVGMMFILLMGGMLRIRNKASH